MKFYGWLQIKAGMGRTSRGPFLRVQGEGRPPSRPRLTTPLFTTTYVAMPGGGSRQCRTGGTKSQLWTRRLNLEWKTFGRSKNESGGLQDRYISSQFTIKVPRSLYTSTT